MGVPCRGIAVVATQLDGGDASAAGRDAALRALRNATRNSSANRTVEKIAAAHIELASPGEDPA